MSGARTLPDVRHYPATAPRMQTNELSVWDKRHFAKPMRLSRWPANCVPNRISKGNAMSDMIRVLIVEREPLFRRGLAGCLAVDNSTEVIASAANADEGFRLADEHLPDVVLVGTTLQDAPGLSAATEFRRRYPSIATIVWRLTPAAAASSCWVRSAIRRWRRTWLGADPLCTGTRKIIGIIDTMSSLVVVHREGAAPGRVGAREVVGGPPPRRHRPAP